MTGSGGVLRLGKRELAELEQTLGKHLTGVASELRLVDVADFIAFIRTGQIANLSNIVQSSTELYFKPGTLSLEAHAEAELAWDDLPVITLPMHFRHGAVHAYFKLRLAAEGASVALEALAADAGISYPGGLSGRLAAALDQARIQNRHNPGLILTSRSPLALNIQ